MISCKKIDSTPNEPIATDNKLEVRGIFTETVCPPSNENLLQAVLNGGTWFFGNSGIQFPTFVPPVNDNGMLSFQSMAAYDSFSKAVSIMEDNWNYSDIDYEDTPEEIYHLGEESLNAFDSAMGFQSLRHKYDLNEFYNHDWIDTATLYVEDDDYQIVFNQNHEVKIGGKYYKYLNNIIISVVNNSNYDALQTVRREGIFAHHPDISYYNEETGTNENPPFVDPEIKTEGCGEFSPLSHATNLTPLTSTSNQWEVELSTDVYWDRDVSILGFDFTNVLANYSINWGDGTTTNFIGFFVYPNRIRHTYSQLIPPGNSVIKNITVSCQVINPAHFMTVTCGSIGAMVFNSSSSVTLSTPAIGDCMFQNVKREFKGNPQTTGGKEYRLECKLKQKTNPIMGFPHIKTIATFTKKKGNKWKNCKPISSVILRLRGDVYNEYTCSVLFETLNFEKSTTKKKTLKIKTKDVSLPNNFNTRRSLPLAISGDFIWTYNNSQIHVGNYSEVLKP